MITDAQIHVWEVDRPDRPWPAVARNQPQLPNGFSAEQAIAAMDEAGVDRAIIVQRTFACLESELHGVLRAEITAVLQFEREHGTRFLGTTMFDDAAFV